jgi:protein gp37
MGQNTEISWTDSTWTPIRARVKEDAAHVAQSKGYSSLVHIAQKMAGHIGPHCEHMSPACEFCYSDTNNSRCLPSNGTGLPFDRRSRDLVDIFLDEKILLQPLKWRQPKRIFVCSQTDLFGEFVPDEMIDRVFAVMSLCPRHTFQCLSKRPERMSRYLNDKGRRSVIAGEVRRIADRWGWQNLAHHEAPRSRSQDGRRLSFRGESKSVREGEGRVPDSGWIPACNDYDWREEDHGSGAQARVDLLSRNDSDWLDSKSQEWREGRQPNRESRVGNHERTTNSCSAGIECKPKQTQGVAASEDPLNGRRCCADSRNEAGWINGERNCSAFQDEKKGHLRHLHTPNMEACGLMWPLPNLWCGTTCENQEWADKRIPYLLQTPAVVHFVSYEPALGPLSLNNSLGRGLDWVIVGGESGVNARPSHPGWFQSVRDQCRFAGVPFFMKQWGTWGPASQVSGGCITHAVTRHGKVCLFDRESMLACDSDETRWEGLRRLGKKKTGCLLDGVEHKEFPRVSL